MRTCHACQDVGLRAPEGRHPEEGQGLLQRAQIVLAQGEVMREVPGAALPTARSGRDRSGVIAFSPDQVLAQSLEAFDGSGDVVHDRVVMACGDAHLPVSESRSPMRRRSALTPAGSGAGRD